MLGDGNRRFGKPATSSVAWWAQKKRGIEKTLAKSDENGFWCIPLCFRPNPETRVGPFHDQGETRLAGFALKCTEGSQPDFAPKCPFFLVVSRSRDTRKKAQVTKIWLEAFPCVLRPRKKIQDLGHLKINPPPCFVSRPKSDGKASIQIGHFFRLKKGHFPSKRCPDRNFECYWPRSSDSESPRRALSRGGLRKNADSKKHSQKAKKRFLPLCFRPNPDTRVRPFHSQGQTRVASFGLKCAGISQPDFAPNCAFFLVSLGIETLEKKHK